MIFALLDEKGDLVLGDEKTVGSSGVSWDNLLLVCDSRGELEDLLDCMPHGKAKKLHLTELVPKQTVRLG